MPRPKTMAPKDHKFLYLHPTHEDLTASIMATQANQGIPRQPGEASPTSTQRSRPTPESDTNAIGMAAPISDSIELPVLAAPSGNVNEALANVSSKRFNIDTVCAALQHGCSIKSLSEYLGTYAVETLKSQMNNKIDGRARPLFYAIDYAINHDNLSAIELLFAYGADPNAYMIADGQSCQIPVLSFAIVRGSYKLKNTLPIVKMLLSAGAKPVLTPIASGTNTSFVSQWALICNASVNVSHAYFLQNAQRDDSSPIGLKKQLASIHGLFDLLTIDNYLVGQEDALKLVKDSVFAHIATNSQHPLVMAFAGPSGHGKTEMASQMGKLLSLQITVIDCAHMKHDTDLFGSRNGYKRSEEGSQLNNFLAKHDGGRAVIFLDEFDKTPQEIRHSLLLICDSGKLQSLPCTTFLHTGGVYHDRRNNKSVDCSKTLWVLATNLGEHEIKSFHEKKMSLEESGTNVDIPIASLQQEILEKFKDTFGAPFTGRVDVVVPFLPFTPIEQAVVAHSLLLELADEFRLPIDCCPAVKRYIGHSHLDLGNGLEVAQYIADSCYNSELGARSLKRGIEELKRKFVMAYCEAHPTEVSEDFNDQPVRRFRTQVRRKMDDKKDLVVIYQGPTDVYSERGCTTGEAAGRSVEEYGYDSLSSSLGSSDHEDDRFLRDRPQPSTA
ncbi:putative atpase aaa-5 protein [Neofusicoccum parvum UCRNP2]|uniref:Putative atpase aaa-5 protein n=1 Tax=Botryosphaeria parva (strain UCR-NP2) TaxID=1287680 RepID=R1GSP2_BOTPV|nr:putative atpase aaa-5 protein [Neofusicoccum parvum UCRNP2]